MRKWIPICGAVIFSLALTSVAQAQLQAHYKTSTKRPNLRIKLTSRKVQIKPYASTAKPDLGFSHLGITRYKPNVVRVNTRRGILKTSLRHQQALSVSKSSMQAASPKDEDE